MSHFNTIYGYIRTPNEEEDFNRQALTIFPFDKDWPFPNVFCWPEHGGRPAMICFALAWHGRSYAGTEDWEKWLDRFESLLGHLRVIEAEALWNEEMLGDLSVYYACKASWVENGYQPVGQNPWVRVTTNKGSGQPPKSIEEEKVF